MGIRAAPIPERFHLIAPYETDPRKWLALPWIDQYSGKQYRISTTLATGTRQIARVKSYGDVLEEYEFHEEAKCADASGAPCGQADRWGCCSRRHVAIDWPPCFIGKESNKLEEVEEGGVPAESDVYTIYDDPRRDEWETKWLPLLLSTPVPKLLEQGVSRATIYAARSGRDLYDSTKAKLIQALSRGS